MKVKLLFFSVLRDVAGCSEVDWSCAAVSITVAELLDLLFVDYPGLREWNGRILVAIDQEYADSDAVVKSGSEVAIMPPVQGG